LKKPLLIILFVLIADQALKFWIKTHMTLGQEFHVMGNWFIIHFTENEGMAFGITFGGETGKLMLSIFRIIAIIIIAIYLFRLRKKDPHPGLIVSFSLILAGAIGNMIDSAFYGLFFSNSSYHTVAQFLHPEGGYSSFLHGKVVDMFYFPIIQTTLPDWVPISGGRQFIFFRPVFNIADASITSGVLLLLFFQKRFFAKQESPVTATEEVQDNPTSAEN
jgi:signal peptidase II